MSFRLDYKIASDPQKFIDGINRAMAKQEEMNQGAKRFNETGKQGSTVWDGMTSKLTAFLSVGAGLAGITKLARDFAAASGEAADNLSQAEDNLRKVVQISRTPEEYTASRAAMTRMIQEHGLSLNEAAAMYFQGKSLGFADEEIVAAGRFRRFAPDASVLLEATAGLGAAFGPGALGGKTDTRVNALLAAAAESKTGVEEISRLVLTPAQSVKRLRGTAEETLAALSVMTVALASPEEAATALGRFSDIAARDERFRGKGLTGAIQVTAGMSHEEREALFGTAVRAYKGMGVLVENQDKYAETLRTITAATQETGTAQSRINTAIRIAEKDPSLALLSVAERAEEARKLIDVEVLSPRELAYKTIREANKAMMTDAGAGYSARWTTDLLFGAMQTFGAPPEAAGWLARSGLEQWMGNRVAEGHMTEERGEAIVGRLDRLIELAETKYRAGGDIINPGPLE
jgi:hypothetical protein